MNQDFEKELRRAEREKEQARRVESFWGSAAALRAVSSER